MYPGWRQNGVSSAPLRSCLPAPLCPGVGQEVTYIERKSNGPHAVLVSGRFTYCAGRGRGVSGAMGVHGRALSCMAALIREWLVV